MAQPTPNAEVETSGSGGRSAAHAAKVWLGSGFRHTGDSFVLPGDDTSFQTDEDTMVVGANTSSGTGVTITVDLTTGEEGRPLYVYDSGGNAQNNTITVTGGTGVDISGTANITTQFGATLLMAEDDAGSWVALFNQ